MQRFTFQLSIGGSRIMSTKETIDLDGSPKPKKKSEKEKVPNGDIITAENEQRKQSEKNSDMDKNNTDKDKTEVKNEKNKEKDEKPKGLTKEVEEQIMKNYKDVSDEYKKSLIQFFRAADTDNVGYLTIQKFAPAVKKLGYTGNDRAIAKMFIDINSNFDGEITIDEFMNEMTKKDPRKMSDQELVKWFNKFDSNKDGFISKQELEKMMDAIKMSKTDMLVNEMFRRADFDGDGKISLEEFRKSCKYKAGLVIV